MSSLVKNLGANADSNALFFLRSRDNVGSRSRARCTGEAAGMKRWLPASQPGSQPADLPPAVQSLHLASGCNHEASLERRRFSHQLQIAPFVISFLLPVGIVFPNDPRRFPPTRRHCDQRKACLPPTQQKSAGSLRTDERKAALQLPPHL